MAAVESSFKHHFLKHKEIQIHKFSILKHHQATKTPKPIHGSENFVINLPEHVLTESETSVLKKGLNFAITNRGSNLDMACVAEFARSKLPPALGMELCWRIRCMLEKSKPPISNMTKSESMALKALRNNKQIRILQADKGNCTVVSNESTYKEKISSLLESGVYEILPKDPTSQIERKIRQLLTKHKTVLPVALKRKLTPYHSKPPHLYGLPKIHKPDIPLRPIVSSIDSPCYALSEFLHKILSPLAGNTGSFVKNSEHFITTI
jgi:hypothetical protein